MNNFWTVSSILFIIPVCAFCALGTPPNLRDIYIGKCYEYVEVVKKDAFYRPEEVDCEKLYDLFLEAFVGRDPCDVPPERYRAYVDASAHEMTIHNRALLATGNTKPFIYQIANMGLRYFTMVDTLTVYPVNEFVWCGKKNSDELNTESCPDYGFCVNLSYVTLYSELSRKHVRQMSGTLHVLFNGSSRPMFSFRSYLVQHELIHINKTKVKKILAHVLNIPPHSEAGKSNEGETCQSLLAFREYVEKEGMQYECRENEKLVFPM
ncbi:hypothetical protein HELRODRAFT_171506 [Helobdella robusta]|uniref:Uncharacterized protein n=1 Tax=Helobdella robusta TaxID=6412 RepID=T1F4C9_HELRO|nr:hypothetical protein HELRODRAFT_171506 [Helobdella robusta]ESO05167.1 hypothetical protein HELRODRAFT_171506 [Helobdella robusta]